jgi:enolase
MTTIESVYARQILDSRGNPTVEVDLYDNTGSFGRASVPSGASTGKREALELRDGDLGHYLGKSVRKAVDHINKTIAPLLKGVEVTNQQLIDETMIKADGTENKETFGANAILAVSMAACRCGAASLNKPLFRYLREDLKVPRYRGSESDYFLPAPLMNIINGGAHASNNLDIQEFMIVPHMDKPFSENFRAGVEIFHHLKSVLSKAGYSTNVGDEGGFAPSLKSHEEAMDLILQAITNAGYKAGVDVSLALDCAASEFFRDGMYQVQGQAYSSEQMVDYYRDLCDKYPIYSIEDGLDEEDFAGWSKLTAAIGDKIVLVGDDLFVTNKKILARGIDEKQANAILVKVNQIGSLSETFDTLTLAFEHNFKAIISHRSGETADNFIADLATATSSGHIKTGSASRSDRMEKYNQLLRIEELLCDQAHFNVIK